MKRTVINSVTKVWENIVDLPDDWTGAEGEWQIPDGHEFVDGSGSTGFIWDGTQFFNPNQITEEEQAEIYWAALRKDRNALLASSDWTQASDSPLTNENKADWASYRQELRDLPTMTQDPVNPTWPKMPV